MGCNLCTLQKREEHYKLLYEIAQLCPPETDALPHVQPVRQHEGARQKPLHPATTYSVRRVPHRAGVAVGNSCQESV
ncbi:hypothetical protein PAMP_014978 [Pampus punctatissimus]